MVKKRRTIISSAKLSRRAAAGRKISAKQKGRKLTRKTKHKLSLYRELVHDYVDKQKREGKKITYNEARSSYQMKKIVRDLKSSDKEVQLEALKLTGRRDGIPDSIPVGETATIYGVAA